ncbi:MAG TPA: zf-HC2 domain-containing protein [Chthonomonadaceae bacterium]|nr:zf-HC2 domain-containing protein [Chthonomonadaceae bacterium]
MFDRCRAWRSMMTRRAEGLLSPAERALLENHVDACAACRRADAADEALHDLCLTLDSGVERSTAREFDDRVVTKLRSLPLDDRAAKGWRERIRDCSAGVSLDFCIQLAGGGLAAASITAILLVSALNPPPASRAPSAYEVRTLSAAERSEPPVPLESLFQTSSPRAAMLWATPGRPQFRADAADAAAATRRQPSRDRRATRRRGARVSRRYVLS